MNGRRLQPVSSLEEHDDQVRDGAAPPRERLIEAAKRCFVRSGFHGARMAQIAKEARMSPGHIYHYFDSKERMIEDIIRSYVEEKAEALSSDRYRGEGTMEALAEGIAAGIAENSDPFWSLLTLEITAEASRNEDVAAIVRCADAQLKERFREVLSKVVELPDLDERIEVFVAMIQGLGLRTVRNPALDVEAIAPYVEQVMRFLFVDPPQTR